MFVFLIQMVMFIFVLANTTYVRFILDIQNLANTTAIIIIGQIIVEIIIRCMKCGYYYSDLLTFCITSCCITHHRLTPCVLHLVSLRLTSCISATVYLNLILLLCQPAVRLTRWQNSILDKLHGLTTYVANLCKPWPFLAIQHPDYQ